MLPAGNLKNITNTSIGCAICISAGSSSSIACQYGLARNAEPHAMAVFLNQMQKMSKFR